MGTEHSARLKTELLVQLDGLHSHFPSDTSDTNGGGGVFVMAATNLPWALDPAFRRRFEPRLHIPLPDRVARRQLFSIHARKWDNCGNLLTEEDLDRLADATRGYSGSDIANIVKHALEAPLRAVQSARFFKVVQVQNIDDRKGDKGEEMHTPCEEGEEGALEMTWESVPKNGLLVPAVTAEDFWSVLKEQRVKSSVGADELQRYKNWTDEFGLEWSAP